ncbi:MAG TPA: sialidase family protein [Planctomycetaceae bacterium]|nr:sialidase family protein [Planctomycetaceae bacterium]
MKPLTRWIFPCFCLPTILTGAVQTALAAEPAGGPELVMIAEAKGKNVRNSEGTLVELQDGALLLIWQEFEQGPGGDSDFFPSRLAAMTSRDGGRSWGGRRVLVETAPGDTNVFSPSLVRLQDGGILFCYMTYHGFDKAQNKYPPASAFALLSRDEGRTFTPLGTLWKERPITLASSTLRQLSGGRVIIPANRDLSKKGESDHWEAGVLFTDDGGKTWEWCDSWVDVPMRGAMEPHIAELRDGRLLMVMRTQLGAVYRAESGDKGKTWSKGTSLGIEAPESCPDLLRIPRTGDLLLVWNASRYDPRHFSHFGKRTPLSVAVSRDDGKTWSAPRHIETDPNRAYSNPGSLFTRDGTLILNYWTCEYQPSGAMSNFPIHLKGAIVGEDWLYGRK